MLLTNNLATIRYEMLLKLASFKKTMLMSYDLMLLQLFILCTVYFNSEYSQAHSNFSYCYS